MQTGSPSRLSNATPVGDTASVPTSRSTPACLVCGMATPRPMPVEPSSSRLRMARMMSSVSVPRNCPAPLRLSTMPRMTASLVVATSDGMIASRTTNSDMRIMMILPSLLADVLVLRGTGHFAGRGSPATVLDLFFIAAKLSLKLVQHQIDRREHVVLILAGDEVVLVLGLNEELDEGLVLLGLLDVHRDLDHGQPVEHVGKFERLLADDCLGCITEVTVPDGDLHLHDATPGAAPSFLARR